MRTEAEIAEMQYWDERKAKEPTLRDQFAMAALQGLMTDKDIGPDEACRVAYEVADEMLEARK